MSYYLMLLTNPSDIFIERGKQSGLEALMRMGEVDNVGDLEKYGYGFFKVNEIQ
jgi:hypothetical protein